MLAEWRAEWADVHYSVSAVAKEAGLAADNVQRIVDGREGGLNPGKLTTDAIKAALKRLRDTCPTCRRSGYKEALSDVRHNRGSAKRRRGKETAG